MNPASLLSSFVKQEGAHPGFPVTPVAPKSPVLGHREVRHI